MKILMLCDFYNSSVEYQENLLTKYYVKHGHSVVIIASCFDSVFKYIANDYSEPLFPGVVYQDGAKIYRERYLINVLGKLRFYRNILPILKEEKPDLIFVHDISPNVVDAIPYLKANPSVRMIMDYHADYSNSGKNWLSLKILHGVIRKYFLNRAKPYISKIFPVVPGSADFLRDIYGVADDEMELLPLAADIDEVRVVLSSDARHRLRKRHNIPDEALVVFTGGKLTKEKRTDLLVKVFAQQKYSSYFLVVIGSPLPEEMDYLDGLKEAARAFPNILFTGWIKSNDIYEYLVMSDVAVFPAAQTVIWQKAISIGLPLLVGNFGGQDSSYLSPNENMIILPPNQIGEEKLEQSLDSLLLSEERRNSMREGAIKTTRELLDWNTLIYKTLRFNVVSKSSGFE